MKGKIIICDTLTTGENEMLAGAVGSIMIYPGPYFEAIGSYPLPVSIVNSDQASIMADYLESTE